MPTCRITFLGLCHFIKHAPESAKSITQLCVLLPEQKSAQIGRDHDAEFYFDPQQEQTENSDAPGFRNIQQCRLTVDFERRRGERFIPRRVVGKEPPTLQLEDLIGDLADAYSGVVSPKPDAVVASQVLLSGGEWEVPTTTVRWDMSEALARQGAKKNSSKIAADAVSIIVKDVESARVRISDLDEKHSLRETVVLKPSGSEDIEILFQIACPRRRDVKKELGGGTWSVGDVDFRGHYHFLGPQAFAALRDLGDSYPVPYARVVVFPPRDAGGGTNVATGCNCCRCCGKPRDLSALDPFWKE